MRPTDPDTARSGELVSLAMGGMSRDHGAAVTGTIGRLLGAEVERVAVDSASVLLASAAGSAEMAREAVREAGYQACVTKRPLLLAIDECCCAKRSG
jgi:hypothetical protein